MTTPQRDAKHEFPERLERSLEREAPSLGQKPGHKQGERSDPPKDLEAYATALTLGLGRVSYSGLASSWLVGEALDVLPRLYDYRVHFGDYVASETLDGVAQHLDETGPQAENAPTKYGNARRLGKALADVGSIVLEDLGLYLMQPTRFVKEDRDRFDATLQSIAGRARLRST